MVTLASWVGSEPGLYSLINSFSTLFAGDLSFFLGWVGLPEMTRLFQGTPCPTSASLPDSCLGRVVELPVWSMVSREVVEMGTSEGPSQFLEVVPYAKTSLTHCCLSFITLQHPETEILGFAWHPGGATGSNTSSPQWQWYMLKLLYCMVYHGRMHFLSHVLLSQQAQQSLHHTGIPLVPLWGAEVSPRLRAMLRSGSPCKRCATEISSSKRWVKYYKKESDESIQSKIFGENLIKNKVRIGRLELIMHFCQLLWCLSYCWQMFFAGWNPRLATKKDVM